MSKQGRWQAIKNMDAFPRAQEHLMQKTSSGAAVSAAGLFIMAVLFVHELRFYLEAVTVHEMSVDTKRGEKLPIHINMTFPGLPCEVLSLDAIDMSGKHEVDLDTNIWKLRVHRDGYILGSEFISDLVEGEHKKEEHKVGHKDEHKDGHKGGDSDFHLDEHIEVHKNEHIDVHENEHINVHENEHIEVHKNEHTDVHRSEHEDDHPSEHEEDHHREHGEDHHSEHEEDRKNEHKALKGHEHDKHGGGVVRGMPIHSDWSQKDPIKVIHEVKKAIEDGEGCQIFGVLDVERVAGNFHISMHGLSLYVAAEIFHTGFEVNVSHIIHDLSFGPAYPGAHNPLDGSERILFDTSGTFKYFLKIVPTEYHYASGEVMPTNQFSVTEYYQQTKPTDRSFPAVYFVYDLSPIVVTITERRRYFGHFITRLCAVLGGTFAVTGMLDKWMFRIIELLTSSTKGTFI